MQLAQIICLSIPPPTMLARLSFGPLTEWQKVTSFKRRRRSVIGPRRQKRLDYSRHRPHRWVGNAWTSNRLGNYHRRIQSRFVEPNCPIKQPMNTAPKRKWIRSVFGRHVLRSWPVPHKVLELEKLRLFDIASESKVVYLLAADLCLR